MANSGRSFGGGFLSTFGPTLFQAVMIGLQQQQQQQEQDALQQQESQRRRLQQLMIEGNFSVNDPMMPQPGFSLMQPGMSLQERMISQGNTIGGGFFEG